MSLTSTRGGIGEDAFGLSPNAVRHVGSTPTVSTTLRSGEIGKHRKTVLFRLLPLGAVEMRYLGLENPDFVGSTPTSSAFDLVAQLELEQESSKLQIRRSTRLEAIALGDYKKVFVVDLHDATQVCRMIVGMSEHYDRPNCHKCR